MGVERVVEISEGKLRYLENEAKRWERRTKALERKRFFLQTLCRFRINDNCHADPGQQCVGQCSWPGIDFDRNHFLVIPEDRR